MYFKDKLAHLSFVFTVLLTGTFFQLSGKSIDTRSDSFDVLKYDIGINLANLSSRNITATCNVSFKVVATGLKKVTLELYKLQVDSIKYNNALIPFFYNDSILVPVLPLGLNTGDTASLKIYYHGNPKKDPGGWGGFYFNDADGGYAFNLGVTFSLNPHNFGRAWFPCVDNFVDRALYEFYVTTDNSKKAFCNGLLVDSSSQPNNTVVWHWKLKESIPAYLASVAVGPYVTLKSTWNSSSGVKPVEIGVIASDTASAKICFKNLNSVLSAFENRFGTYRFDRVGYVAVPFTGGAMEHATNIAFPKYAISQGKASESLWAHELSHHWFGDLVTCRTAEDMWLNEGFASYCERIFYESIYGKSAYLADVADNHYMVLRYAHLVDKGYRPLTPMDTRFTYGIHVYKKGADVLHTLRTCLGDSVFFTGIRSFLDDFEFKDVSTSDFEKSMSTVAGKDISSFFNDWVFNPGFPHYEIENFSVNSGSQFVAAIKIKQRVSHAPHLYSQVPVEITFMDKNWSSVNRTVSVSDIYQGNFTLPFEPVFAGLNMDGKISDAVTRYKAVIKKADIYDVPECQMKLQVNAAGDSSFVYIEHHWIDAPRSDKTPKNIRLSPERYWTVDGIWAAGFSANIVLNYDGRILADPYAGGFLDSALLSKSKEDSIVLMFRPNAWSDWSEYPYYQKFMGSATDKFGTIKTTSLQKGQYAFGVIDHTAGIDEKNIPAGIHLYPNPTGSRFLIEAEPGIVIREVKIFDSGGRQVFSKNFERSPDFTIDITSIKNGVYLVKIETNKGYREEKLVVTR